MEQVTVKELIKKDLKGKIVCFPTDTVYGVGAIYDDYVAIDKIYKMKRRSLKKPLAILTATKDIGKFVRNISYEAQKLIDENWPGPLTLIFKKSENISDKITMGYKTIAMRMPNSKVALSILNHFGPMATTSVNISGQRELNSLCDINFYFGSFLDYFVIDEEILSEKPSTIIDVSKSPLKIIRK